MNFKKRLYIKKCWGTVFFFLLLFLLPKVSIGEHLEDYLFLYIEENAYGFMRADGRIEIAPQWEDAYPFDNGMAIVGEKQNDGDFIYGIINTNGEYVIPPLYSEIEKKQYTYGGGDYYCLYNCTSGILSTEGIFDVEGKTLIAFSEPYCEINILQSGEYIAVNNKKTSLWGYVDQSGDVVIPYQFDEASGFVNGFGLITEYHERCNIEKYALINSRGDKLVLPDCLEAYGLVQNDRFIIRTTDSAMKYGLADITSKIIIEPQYDWISDFKNDIAVVENETKYGCIFTNGALLLPVVFDYVSIEEYGIVLEFMSHQYIFNLSDMDITPYNR